MFIKKSFNQIILLVFLAVGLTDIHADENSQARKIMEQVDQREDGDNRSADIEMILIDKNNNQRPRKIKSFTRDFGEDTYSVLFFLEPTDVKNTAFLTYDYSNPQQDDDQWLYLPALRKSKRIASSDKSGSFMGSDFNYSDMTPINIDDYRFQVLKEIEVRGNPCWVIEAIPRSADIVAESGYKKSLLIVRKDIYFIVRAVHWTDNGNILKYFDATNIKRIDNIWTATDVSMTSKRNKQTIHKTEMKFSNIKYNQNLEENLFTVRRLEKGL